MQETHRTHRGWQRHFLDSGAPALILSIALVLGLFIWVADAMLDYFIFYEGGFFELLLLSPPQHEIYIRFLIVLCFVGFGGVVAEIVLNLQKARSELQERETNLRTTLQSIGDAVIATDTLGRIRRMNDEGERLTGWSRQEALGRPLEDVFRIKSAQSRETVANPVQKVLQEGIVQGLANHTVLIARNDRELQIADSASPIRNDQGEIIGVVLVFRDVTDQYRQQEALHRDQRRLANVVEGTDAGIWERNVQTLGLFFDVSWLRNLGYSPDDFPEMTLWAWRELLHPEDLEESDRLIAEHLSGHRDAYECEIRVRRKDGSWAWVLDRGKVTEWTEHGEPLLLSGTVQNITERKLAEENVRHLNRVLHAVRKVNQLITEERDRGRLIQGTCDNFVETRGCDYAWIALMDGSGECTTIAEAPRHKVFSSHTENCLLEELPYCGRKALEQSEVVLLRSHEAGCADCPGSDTHEHHTGLAVPLEHGGSVYGVMALALPAPVTPQKEEQGLVRELAGDIGFALYSIELEEKRRRHEAERDITLRLLRLLHQYHSVPELVSGVTSLFKEWSGCEAIGIRLRQGEDYPYYVTQGFPQEHIRLENSLCEVDPQGDVVRDFQGNPVLECMCGTVLQGRFDPDLSFFTERGSFWTNSTTDLLASSSEEDRQARTRNRCQGEGYESVALIPLRHREQTLGLLQINDSRRNQFTERWIRLLERLGENLALGLVQRQTEDALRESEHLFRQLFEQAAIGIFIASSEHSIIEVNQTALAILGYSREEILRMGARDILHPENLLEHSLESSMDKMLSGETVDMERRFRTRQGEYIQVLINMARLPHYSEEASHMVMFQDISHRKRMEEQLRVMSLYDSLTGLYNRNFFEAEMKRLSDGRYTPLGIVICDLDGLKFVNDTLGHNSGDEMLSEAAVILKQSFRSSDIVARIGGDEFAVLLPESDQRETGRMVRRLRRAFEEHNSLGPHIPLPMSIGYAVSGPDTTDMQALFREADNRMYREKVQREQSSRSAIVQGLTSAIEARDFATEGHCDRLQDLAAPLARSVGLTEDRMNDLFLFSRFHDLGKVGIPDRILFKPGPLTEDEFQEMKRHSEVGHRIAQSVPDLEPIADWILKHHERWDGHGYPLGLQGEAIPLECRIIAIADAYDAMTSDRPYRKAMSREEAIEELRRCSGAQFDPDLTEQFIRIL